MGIKDTRLEKGQTGEKLPKGATASDTSGERKQKLVGGVAMGKADALGLRPMSHAGKFDGKLGELKGGSKEHDCYSHERIAHDQDK